MKLLVVTGNFENYLSPNFHYLLTELGKIAELIVWDQPGDINEILNQLPVSPDFILINEFGETNSPVITGLSTLSIPFAVTLHDLHYRIKQRKELMEQEKVKYVFTIYRDKFLEWYPEYWNRVFWLPHHVNTDIFKDYCLPKTIDYLLMGAVHWEVYPVRNKVLNKMMNKPGFVYHEHPGYRYYDDNDEVKIGRNFALEINKAKMFFTCDSKYHYPLAKYYEVLACNALLLAPASKELMDLGFIPGVHFVSIDGNNFEQKAEYYLHHEQERLQIAAQGYEMVHSKHSTRLRASQLMGVIEEILELK